MTDGTRMLTIDELIELPRLSDARISPDGAWVAFQRSEANWAKNRYDRSVCVVEVADTGNEISLPGFTVSASPRWAPDGDRLLVVGREEREDAAFVFVLSWPSLSIEARLPLPAGGHAFAWSPNGSSVTCVAAARAGADEEAFRERYGDVRVIGEEGPGDGLWIADADGAVFRPIGPAGHVAEYAWHPSGRAVALVSLPSPSPEAWDRGTAGLLDVDTELVTKLPCGIGCGAPVWSPTGETLLVKRVGSPSFIANNELIFHAPRTGETTAMTPVDGQTHPIAWRSEGVYFLGVDGASALPYRLDPETRNVDCVVERQEGGFALDEGWVNEGCTFPAVGRTLVAICHAEASPGDVGLIDTETGGVRFLTRRRASRCAGRLPTSEIVEWTTDDGVQIEGVLHGDPAWEPDVVRPLVVVMHGGPTAVALAAPLAESDWKLSAIPQVVGRGAYVLRPNYRGSVGYGERFRVANQGALGRVNLADVVAGIDALAGRGWVDRSRVAVSGASHGGYLSAYFGVCSGRFAASIVQCGIADWRLNYGSNLQPDWERQYLHGTPWEEQGLYDDLSPVTHAGEQRTPTLILHGDADTQAPTANATLLHRALCGHGVPVRCVLYGKTGHGPARPRELRHHMEEVIGWLDRWLFRESGPGTE